MTDRSKCQFLIFTLLPLLLLSQRLKYDFTAYNELTNTVVNQGVGGLFDLTFTPSATDTVQDFFKVHSNSKFGMQYSGQYSWHTHAGNQVFNNRDFFFQIYFYTCITKDFVIFSVQEIDDAYAQRPYFSLGVQGDGFYYFEIRLTNNEATSYYSFRTTTLSVKQGWNYIAFYLDEIYEYSYIKMWNRYEGLTASTTVPGFRHEKYETFLAGFYDETADNADGNTNVNLIFGCKTYVDYSGVTADESHYGLCMQGWIQYFEGYTAASISAFSTDANIQNEHNQVTDFCNTNKGPVLCYSTFVVTDTRMFSWDSSSAVIANQLLDLSGSWTCTVALTTGNTYPPFYQPSIGRITFNETNYFQCQITKATAGSLKAFFGAIFTMEAWFRFDPLDMRPNGYISQVFALYDSVSKQYKLGFGVSNTFLRIYLDDTIQDYHFLFNQTAEYWHYVAISYTRLFERETQLNIFIDDIQVLTAKVFDWFNFDTTSTSYFLHIGKNFPGIVRKTKINSRAYCVNKKSLWSNTNQALCNKRGDSQCSFCDIDEVGVPVGTFNCFYTCQDFGYFINGLSACSPCHNSCRYCQSSFSMNDCYMCNETAKFYFDSERGIITPSATDGDRFRCICSEGTYNFAGEKCEPCHSSCQICNHFLNFDCDTCSEGSFRQYGGTCSDACPVNYVKDYENRICSFDQELLKRHERPEDPQGCMHGTYWNWEAGKCKDCTSSCQTCEFSGGYCTSCQWGTYMTMDHSCTGCKQFWSTEMLLGTTGECVEKCGDGANYGILDCDDGNVESGDGCSSKCLTEKGYMCREGWQGSIDNCYYIPTDIRSQEIDSHNNILIQFERPIQLVGTTLTNRDFDIQLIYQNKTSITLEWSAMIKNLPSNYLYIILENEADVRGGVNRDNMIQFTYLASGNVIDINNKEIKPNLRFRAFLNPREGFPQSKINRIERMGKLILTLIGSGLGLWGSVAVITQKTIMPCIFLVLTFQNLFLLACQDFYFDKETTYFFRYFKNFFFEHNKINNYFTQHQVISPDQIQNKIFNKNLYYVAEIFQPCFLFNNGFKILLICFYMLLMPAIIMIDFLLTHCFKIRLQWFHRNVAQKYFFGGPLLILTLLAQPFGLTAALELKLLRFRNYSEIYSLFSALMAQGVVAALWLLIVVLFIYHKKNPNHPYLVLNYSFIIRPFKKSFKHLVGMPIYLTKRIVSYFLLGILPDQASGPLYIQAFLAGGMFFYVAGFRPFKSQITNITLTIMELNLVAIDMLFLPFLKKYDSFKFQAYTIMKIIIFLSLLILNVVYFVNGFYKIYNFWNIRRYGKKVAPLKQILQQQIYKFLERFEKKKPQTVPEEEQQQLSVNEQRYLTQDRSQITNNQNETIDQMVVSQNQYKEQIPDFKELKQKRRGEGEELQAKKKKVKDEQKKDQDSEESVDQAFGTFMSNISAGSQSIANRQKGAQLKEEIKEMKGKVVTNISADFGDGLRQSEEQIPSFGNQQEREYQFQEEFKLE